MQAIVIHEDAAYRCVRSCIDGVSKTSKQCGNLSFREGRASRSRARKSLCLIDAEHLGLERMIEEAHHDDYNFYYCELPASGCCV